MAKVQIDEIILLSSNENHIPILPKMYKTQNFGVQTYYVCLLFIGMISCRDRLQALYRDRTRQCTVEIQYVQGIQGSYFFEGREGVILNCESIEYFAQYVWFCLHLFLHSFLCFSFCTLNLFQIYGSNPFVVVPMYICIKTLYFQLADYHYIYPKNSSLY